MPERDCPQWVSEFAKKLLSFDESHGDNSNVALVANRISKSKLSGSQNDNWYKAERIIFDSYKRQVEGQSR